MPAPAALALHGACSCGRNRLQIVVPEGAAGRATLLYDGHDPHGPAAAPTHLLVPLPWLHSSTHAQWPSESHAAIRRAWSSRRAPHVKRHFCGFCGDGLSLWGEGVGVGAGAGDEREAGETAEWVGVHLGVVEGLATLLKEADGREEDGVEVEEAGDKVGEQAVRRPRGEAPRNWFEIVVQGGVRRRRGGEVGADGQVRVEWEVVEFDGEGDEGAGNGSGKRKLDVVDASEDVHLPGGD